MSQQTGRPTGVTILAILSAVTGAMMVAFGAMFSLLISSFEIAFNLPGFEILAWFVTPILIAVGATNFVVTWGLLKAMPWAWTLMLALNIIAIITNAISFNVVSIIISIVILYYLTRSHVKEYFGRGVSDIAPQ